MRILHLNASPRGEHSVSLPLALGFLHRLAASPHATVDTLDLFNDTIPPFDQDAVAAKMALFTGARTTVQQQRVWQQVQDAVARFSAADAYVINTPIWNNGAPYKLKQYIDLVTQPGMTFGFDPARGYVGTLTGRKAVVIQAAGVYYPGIAPGFGEDLCGPYLRSWLSLMGITDVEVITVTSNPADGQADQTRARANAVLERLASRWAI